MSVKSGKNQACAACKFQRRKCSADCPLAPYFPHNQPKLFQSAHRLFGVKNIVKTLEQIHPTQKNDAMTSIIYQSAMRDKFPVHGCVGEIMNLQFQIERTCMELDAIKSQLALYKQQHMPHSPSSQLQLGMTAPAFPNNALPLLPYNVNGNGNSIQTHHQQPQDLVYGDNDLNFNAPGVYIDSSNKDNGSSSPLWIQQHCYDQNNNNSVTAIQSQFNNLKTIPFEEEAVESLHLQNNHDYDEMPGFFDSIDDRQSSYVDSKQESSSESSLKDTTRTIEHVSENDLKSAAACFTLTGVD